MCRRDASGEQEVGEGGLTTVLLVPLVNVVSVVGSNALETEGFHCEALPQQS